MKRAILCSIGCFLPALALAQEVRPECEHTRGVKQASLYAEDGQLSAARGELEMVLATREGPKHADVWLAYALVAFEQGDLQTAGSAMDQVYEMNEAGEITEPLPPWGERFIARYEASVGKLVLEDQAPRRVGFSARFSAGSPEAKSRAEAFLARTDGFLVRGTLTPIFLPPGRYALGATEVEIRPASERPVVVPVDHLGELEVLTGAARSAEPEPSFPVIPSPYAERCKEREMPTTVYTNAPEDEGGFFAGPWPWILGGVLVAGGAAAAAAVALHEPDWRLRFDGTGQGLGR